MERGLSSLLKWSIENTPTEGPSGTAPVAGQAPASRSQLTPEILAALMGGPSEADMMKSSMEAITSTDPAMTLEAKLVAFDNFEQLIESLDNANNLGPLALWTPLLETLAHPEPEMRKMAAWCVGTAVQNNEPSQARLLAHGSAGIQTLVDMATKEEERSDVRRKALYALSSACRNYQPAMDVFTDELAKLGKGPGKIDAEDMDVMDTLMNQLKAEAVEA